MDWERGTHPSGRLSGRAWNPKGLSLRHCLRSIISRFLASTPSDIAADQPLVTPLRMYSSVRRAAVRLRFSWTLSGRSTAQPPVRSGLCAAARARRLGGWTLALEYNPLGLRWIARQDLPVGPVTFLSAEYETRKRTPGLQAV